MSFIPLIIISYSDLHSKESEIRSDRVEYPDDKDIEYIYKLLNNTPVNIKGISIITCMPELTRFNQDVRERLFDYDIEFSIEI